MPSPTKPSTGKKSPKVTLKTPPKTAVAPATKASAQPRKTLKVNRPATVITTAEERHRLIAEAAYYRAEQRGFQDGNPEQDWFDAAAQVDRLLMGQE